jgi:hypothetical protein
MRSSVRVRRVQLIFSLGTCGRKGGRGRQAGVADARLTDAVQPINTTSTSPRRQRPSAEAEAAQADVRHAAMSGHYAYTNRFRLGSSSVRSLLRVALVDRSPTSSWDRKTTEAWQTRRSAGIVGPSRA